MDNYGQDYFISQEGYASIDFTLLDRPSSTVASAPESTAALLPDLHVADSSFSSFDFLDGPGVDAFGGVLREADEAHSRDQGGYRSDLQKYKKEQRSLHQNSVTLHRGDGDPESELPSTDFHMPFEVQKPMDFFSQGHSKNSAHGEQQAQSPGNDGVDGDQDYFEHGQISQQGAAGGGGWYPSWSANTNQGDQTQLSFQAPYNSNNEGSDERRMMHLKGGPSQIAVQLGYHGGASTQVPSSDPTPKALHAFLPTAKQSDTRQAASMALGIPSAPLNPSSSSVIKSLPRSQPFDYEGLMNGANVGQFRQNAAAGLEATPARRQHTGEASLSGQDAMRSQVPNQSFKFGAQNLGSLSSSVEVSPLKVGDYDFLGSPQYLQKGQAQGEIGQQLAVDDMQGWQQQSLMSQSNQQQPSYQHPYQEIARQEFSRQQHQQQQQVEQQQSQHSRQQQLQQFLAMSNQNPNLGNQFSAFLGESSLQDIPRVVQSERQNPQMAVENSRSLLQHANYQAMNSATNLNWSANEGSAMQGLAHDYLMGADQNFNWQALALKASQQQLDPLYGSLSVNRRDSTAQTMNPYPGMQGGLQEYYGGTGKLTSAAAQVGKPVPRSAGAGSSIFGSEYQPDVYDTGNLQTPTHSSKHQALGKMPFWQNPYPQSVEQQNRTGVNLNQTNLPPRTPQVPSNSQARQQRNWSAHQSQQDSLQTGMLAAEALKQGMIATGMQEPSHQAASQSGNSRQARSQTMEASQFMHQHGSQAAPTSQFLNALGTKQQSGWNRHALQQSVSQTGVSAENTQSVEGIRKSNWSGLNIQQASPESQSLSNLKQQNIWSGHSPQQSRPAASSLHLFTDLDGRRNSIHGSHEVQQGGTQPGGTQQTTKFDVNQQSHSIPSASVQVSDPPNSIADMDARQQSGWRDHLLLQGTGQAGSSLQGYNDLDKTSSWRNSWQNGMTAGGSSPMIELDSRQQSTGWGNSMQQTNSQAAESQVASINSRERSGWSGHDVQQGSPHTNQLLSSLDSQNQTSHLSSADVRLQSGQSGHMLHEEPAGMKSSADIDGRLKGSSSPYNLQLHVARAEPDAIHKAGQMPYNLQSQAGATDAEARLTGGQKLYNLQPQVAMSETDLRQKSVYNLQSQVGAVETEGRLKAGHNSYTLQNQLSAADNEARRKVGHNAYNLQNQIGSSEIDARQKSNQSNQSTYNLQASETDTRLTGSQSTYDLHTQAVALEPDGRSKSAANSYSLQFQVGTTDSDLRHLKGSQNLYSLQTGSVEADVRVKDSQSPYNVQSQRVATELDARHLGSQSTYSLQARSKAADSDARQKGSQSTYNLQKEGQSTYNLQAQVGSFSQPSNVDGRQGRVQRSHSSQGTSQTSNTMYMFPTGSKNQNTSSSLQQANPNSRTSSGNKAENWQKSTLGASGQQSLQQVGLVQVEALDSRQQSGSNSQHGSPQNESQFQPTSNSRPSSRLGRTSLNVQDSTMPGVIGSASRVSAVSHWQTHVSASSASGTSGSEPVANWSRGQTRQESEPPNLPGIANSGTATEPPSWSRGQMLSGRKETEQLNLGVDNTLGGSESLAAWSRAQIMSTRKDEINIGGDAVSGTSEIHPTWSRGQSTAIRKEVEQLNLGGEFTSGANEIIPSWSRGQNADSGKDSEQLNLDQDTSSGAREAAPTWSRGQVPSGLQELEPLKLGAESSKSNIDTMPTWSRGQNVSAHKDSDQMKYGEDPLTTTGSVRKDVLSVRREVEKRSQEEMSFLDAATLSDTTLLASPAPPPDRNMFPGKQKSGVKISPLSRSTLELLSKPEEPDESTSVNDEDEEAEEMEHEDSGGANASSISLAHLRRNQASGPLSPQGFGLRLAPPSHLTQNSQTGSLSRAVGSAFSQGLDATRPVQQLSKEQQQILGSGFTGQSHSHHSSKNRTEVLGMTAPVEAGVPGQQTVPSVGAVPSSGGAFDSSYYRNKDQPSADVGDGPSYLFEGNGSQPSTSRGTSEKPRAGQSFLEATLAGEIRQSSRNMNPNSSQAVDAASSRASEDAHALGGSFSSTPSNAQSHFTSSSMQKAQQFASNLPAAKSSPPKTAALSKLLSSFKDSLVGQVLQAPGQQQRQQQQMGVEKGSAERGTVGVFEALRQSQAAGNRLNGTRSSQWQVDSAQIPNSMKAEVFKRLAAAQAHNKSSQPPLVNENQAGQGTITSVSVQTLASGQAAAVHQVAVVQTNSAQTYPQAYTPDDGGSLGQVYLGQSHIHTVGGKPSAGGQAFAQGLSLSRHDGTSEQSQPGQKHVQNFVTAGQTNNAGQMLPHIGNQSVGSSSAQMKLGQSHGSVQPQVIPGPVTPGQSTMSTMANKQNAARYRGNFPLSSGTGSEFEQGNLHESERGFQSQQPSGPSTVPSSILQSQQAGRMQNNPLQTSFGQSTFQKDPSTRPQASQEELLIPTEGLNTSSASAELIGGMGNRALNTQVFADKDKPTSFAEDENGSCRLQAQPTLSNLEQYGAQHDNQGSSLPPESRRENESGLSGQIVRQENQQQALRQDAKNGGHHSGRKDNQDNLHQQGVSQENQSALHQHGSRQDNQGNAQQLGLRQDNQGSTAQKWQSLPSVEPAPFTDYQFQRLLESQPSIVAALNQYKSDPRLYQLAIAQLRDHFGQQHTARQYAQYQQQGRNEPGTGASMKKLSADNTASATVSQAAQLQAAQMQAAQLQARAAQVQAAQAAQVAQAVQASQSSQLVQAAQAAQAVQAAQQQAQAAIINKNASTAARLHFLSQLAQRGHSANGLAQWYSGRPGDVTSLYASRMGDGKGLIPGARGATPGVPNENQLGVSRYYQNAGLTPPPAKKRKKEYPPLISWRESVSQAGGYVSTPSGAELEWAAATNRIPDKDPYEEVVDLSDTRSVVLTRAKRRLRFTTHLMQQIIPAVSAMQMASKSVEDRVGATYTLAKLSLAEACRIASIARRIKEVAAARDAEESRIEKERELALKEQERMGGNSLGVSLPLNLADRFKLRMKILEGDLQRLESSPSAMELMKEVHEIDRLGVVNRLAVHQTSLCSLSDSPHSRGVPQKYVTTVQMPSKLPEELMCISL